MTQEKDKSEGQPGKGRLGHNTLVGVAPLSSSRPPRPDRGSKTSSPSAQSGAPSVRNFFAPRAPAREASKPTQGHREKQASLEEISSSLLLEDDSSSAVMPGLEELSGSLLLEDPTEVRAEPTAAPAGAQAAIPATAQPMAAEQPIEAPQPIAAPQPMQPMAPSPQPPAVDRDPPAAHQALLGMPELPRSTPAPNLDALPPMPASAAASLEARTVADPFGGTPAPPHAEGLELDDPTRIVPPPPQHMYEALKGYEAEPAGVQPPSAAKISASPGPADPAPPATEPVHGDVEVNTLPPSRWEAITEAATRWLQVLRSSLTSLQHRAGTPGTMKRPLFLGAIAMGSLVVGIALASLIVSLTRKGPDEASEATAKKAVPGVSAAPVAPAPEASQAAAVAPAETPAPAPAPAPMVASTSACFVVGAPRTVAPSAIVAAGIEVRAVGDDMALGFAPNEHQATALRLNAATLASTSKVEAQSADAIRRVVPLASADGALSIADDADRDGDTVQGRRTVPLDPPLEIGAAAGSLVWAHTSAAPAGKLWPLDGDGSVEALRGASDPTDAVPMTAIAFRRAGAIWLGTASGRDALTPLGPLARAAGTSAGVGSPAIAISGGVVMAAWADRAAASDPWRLRWVTFKAGEAPGEPGTFMPPAGGRGEQAMSPGIAAVPGGRFLLVWTEGPATRHDVRALTLSREGQALGKPLVISSKNANAGQGQAGINVAGRGAVAFLESAPAAEGGFQVLATPIRCAP